MSKHLIVLFAYHYPPENAIGGMRPARFVKYLSQMGYDCLVFTAAEQPRDGDPCTISIPDPFAAPAGGRRGAGGQA